MSQPIEPIVLLEEIFPGDTNAYGTAFGGKILALMDRAAGLAASRYAKCNFVTVSLDALEFRAPVKQGEIARVEARVVYTSSHTAGIQVQVYAVDKLDWQPRPCCHGTLFMVAVSAQGTPLTIPQLEPDTEAARVLWDEAMQIHNRMTERKKKP